MKRLTLLVMCSSLLFGDMGEIESLYSAGDYRGVIEAAKASKGEYANPKLHLLWAKAAQNAGDLEGAMSAYERVLILDENNLEAHLALAQLYQKTKRYDLARQEAQKLKSFNLTPQQRSTLESILSTGITSLKAQASLALGYDTNINVSPGIIDGYVGADELDTMFAKLNAQLSYVNDLDAKGGWYLRGEGAFSHQKNFDTAAGDYDLSYGVLSGGLGYGTSKLNIYIPLEFNAMHYLTKAFLYEFKLEPKLYYTLNSQTILNLHVKYVERNYIQSEEKNRDDSAYGAGVGAYYFSNANFAYADLSYSDYQPQHTLYGSYVKRNYLTMSLGAYYAFGKSDGVRFDYRFRDASYDDGVREDTYNSVHVKYSHFFAKLYEVYLSQTYIQNSSNIAGSEYDKSVSMLGLSINY